MILSLVMFFIGAVVAFAARFWFDLDPLDVALFFTKLIYAQLVWVPFSVTRSLAKKINRNEIASAD